jgi:hypothetical protein
VRSVIARVSAYTLPLVRVGPGRFGLHFAIPNGVPGFFHGTYTLEVMARASSGADDRRSVTLVFE